MRGIRCPMKFYIGQITREKGVNLWGHGEQIYIKTIPHWM